MLQSLFKAEKWRYERKYVIQNLSLEGVRTVLKLHPALFSEIYHERRVNNIYFDSMNLTNYFDNVDGKSQRLKVRIRWYEELFGFVKEPILEIKIKNGLLGTKNSYQLTSLSVDEDMTIEHIHELFAQAEIPASLKFYLKSLSFSLLNSYQREYFLSANGRFRITIDSGLRFFNLSPMGNIFLQETRNMAIIILEMKYDQDAADLADPISTSFPFRMTKSSKYISGINLLND